MVMLNTDKCKKNIDREEFLRDVYQDKEEYSYWTQINRAEFMEKRLNEQRFGVFGNALITVVMIAVIVGILYLILK